MKRIAPDSIKLSVSLGDETREYVLGHQDLHSLLYSLDDGTTDAFFWRTMSRHPSADVREAALRSDKLNDDADVFLEDPSVEVRVAAIESGPDGRHFRLDTLDLVRLLETDDIRVAKAIATNLGKFPEADRQEVIAAICRHPDPGVRLALAEHGRQERRRLRTLLRDEDPDVVRVARVATEE